MTPTLPEERLAVLSTHHVSRADADALSDGGAVANGGMVREYGWLLHTRRSLDGYPTLSFVLGYCKAQGFDWVLFDQAADAVDELPSFDW